MGPNNGPPPYERHFSPEPASARSARRWAFAVLDELGLGHLEDRVGLLVGEMAVNAIFHARTDYSVRLGPLGAGGLRLEVHDGSLDLPRRKVVSGSETLTYGRGLTLIEGTADRWGVSTAAQGKYVWAEVDR